jgi:hypothetical protein
MKHLMAWYGSETNCGLSAKFSEFRQKNNNNNNNLKK